MCKWKEWIEELGDTATILEQVLEGDMRIVYDACGPSVVLSLLTHLPGLHLYISTVPITKARIMYISKFYDGTNAKEIARKLGVSERFVRKHGKKERSNEI